MLLITIPFSHYCEKARWALERGRVGFREEPHAPFFSRLATRRHGGKASTVPVFVKDDKTLLTDSTDILHFVDALAVGSQLTAGARTICSLGVAIFALRVPRIRSDLPPSRQAGPAQRSLLARD